MKQLHRNKICLFLLLIAGVLTYPLQAQNQDSFEEQFKKEFESFRDSIETEYSLFLSKTDSAFYEFLKNAWDSCAVTVPEKQTNKKPISQPQIKTDSIRAEELIPSGIETKPETIEDTINKDSLIIETPKLQLTKTQINTIQYNGISENLISTTAERPSLKNINNIGIADFYKSLALQKEWQYNLPVLLKAKKKYKLNDWAYFRFLKLASKQFYPTPNEQRLLVWFLLKKSGYLAQVAYSDDKILIIAPCSHKVFNMPFLQQNGINYYLIDEYKTKQQTIYTYKEDSKVTGKYFSFLLNEYPEFAPIYVEKTIYYKDKAIPINIDLTLIDFYSSFPLCELKNYFYPETKTDFWNPIDQVLTPLINNKTPQEKIDILLNFVQKAIPYKTDHEQFGKERYLFVEETLFYSAADCEDRAILLAQMIKHYTNLHSVALDFPGHVALAVNLDIDTSGTYVMYNDLKYTVCDPTYINAKSGMLPEVFTNADVEIIDWENSNTEPKVVISQQDAPTHQRK